MTDLNYSDGDKLLVPMGKGVAPLVYRREGGGAWKLMNLTDFTVDALIKAGKAELL